MTAFRELVNAIQTLPNNSSSLKPQLNRTVNAMRILKAAKTANPNAAAAMAAANVPAAPTKKSIVTRAVNTLTAFKTRLTPTRVQAMGANVANALSFAQKLRRKGGVRGALGQALKLPELGARGISKVATAVGKGYGNWRAAQLNPVNKNFEATLKRYRNLSKNTSLTSANSNIKWAKALANNNKKNLYISWNPLYTGNRNSANYAQKVLNWSRRKLAADLAANSKLRITIKANNKNLNKFNQPNKVQALAEVATNYATLKRLLGGENTNVTKFINGLESTKNTRKQKFDNIVRAAGMNIGLAKVREETAAAAAAQEKAASEAARKALLQKLYPGLNYNQAGGKTPFQKAANIRQKFNVRNVRLSNAERALLSQNDLAVYNTAKKLKSIPKVGNQITPRTAAEAQVILNAANLSKVVPVNNQPAINAKLRNAGIIANKYNFTKIKPVDFKLKQEQLAVTALQKATANKMNANKIKAEGNAARAAITKIIEELQRATTQSGAKTAVAKLEGKTIPPELVAALDAAKQEALGKIKAGRLKNFVTRFYKRTSGKGLGNSWKPTTRSQNALKAQLINNMKGGLVNAPTTTRLQENLKLNTPVNPITYNELVNAINKAAKNGVIGGGAFGYGKNKNIENRKQFMVNMSRNNFPGAPDNANLQGRLNRYFATP